MHSKLSNKELVAAGHQFAANLSSDTPLIDMAKMVSELATQLDVALVVAVEAGKQRDEMAVEASYFSQQIKQHSQRTHFCDICGKDDPCHNDDVCWALAHPMPATDAYLNAVRAEGVEMFVAFNQQLAERYPTSMVSKSLEVMELNAEQFVIRIGAENDTTSSQYESLTKDGE